MTKSKPKSERVAEKIANYLTSSRVKKEDIIQIKTITSSPLTQFTTAREIIEKCIAEILAKEYGEK